MEESVEGFENDQRDLGRYHVRVCSGTHDLTSQGMLELARGSSRLLDWQMGRLADRIGMQTLFRRYTEALPGLSRPDQGMEARKIGSSGEDDAR